MPDLYSVVVKPENVNSIHIGIKVPIISVGESLVHKMIGLDHVSRQFDLQIIFDFIKRHLSNNQVSYQVKGLQN